MLSLLSYVYGKVIDLRNYLYDRDVLESFDLGARTISIGNVTTGGTGKTPLVAYVADLLAERGEKVCILTRGYGRDDEGRRVLVSDGERVLANYLEAGDEPVELAQKLLGKAIVIADADRVAAAEWAKRKFGITAFVLDDGFQHRRARRNIDIVCIDATDPFGGGKLLPAGRLREPVRCILRADIIVITRTDLVRDISDLEFEISKNASDAMILEGRTVANIAGSDKPVFAFCGIGNPKSFFSLLEREGWNVTGTQVFPDHHAYVQADIDHLHTSARKCGAEIFVTTAKDAVKLSHLKFEIPYQVIEIDITLDKGKEFAELL